MQRPRVRRHQHQHTRMLLCASLRPRLCAPRRLLSMRPRFWFKLHRETRCYLWSSCLFTVGCPENLAAASCSFRGRLREVGARQVTPKTWLLLVLVPPVRGKLRTQSCCYGRSSRGSRQATPAILLLQAPVPPVRGKLRTQSCCYRRPFRQREICALLVCSTQLWGSPANADRQPVRTNAYISKMVGTSFPENLPCARFFYFVSVFFIFHVLSR